MLMLVVAKRWRSISHASPLMLRLTQGFKKTFSNFQLVDVVPSLCPSPPASTRRSSGTQEPRAFVRGCLVIVRHHGLCKASRFGRSSWSRMRVEFCFATSLLFLALVVRFACLPANPNLVKLLFPMLSCLRLGHLLSSLHPIMLLQLVCSTHPTLPSTNKSPTFILRAIMS